MRRLRCAVRPVHALVASACLAATLSTTGCYASGRRVDQQTLVELQPGITTCLEIRARYGPPTSTTLTSGGPQQLVYAYTQGQMKPESFVPILGSFVRGSTSETTTVTFECDARGVLLGYTATQGQDAAGSGFISGGRQR